MHIVFAAGTGVLCFVDLVAQLALALMELDTAVNQGEDMIDLNGFKLVMYVSFTGREDAIALELLYALSDFCMQLEEQYCNFELFVRLKKEGINPQKWDNEFIVQELAKYDTKAISRLWVCGPPTMTQTFDMLLSSD